METADKLAALKRVAKELNGIGATWAVGASALLYFKGITDGFNDIDITVSEEDAEIVERALGAMGRLEKKELGGKRPRISINFVVDGTEFEVLAGMTIVKDGTEHSFPLNKGDIRDHAELDGVMIPLQGVEEWREYYSLMGKTDRVAQIDAHLAAHGGGAHKTEGGGIFNKKPEECRYSFFQHKECEFFPCHNTDRPEDFNCLFCYCPLYMLGEDCGGNYRYLENGVKDCSLCLAPHGRGSYTYVISRYGELAKRAAKGARSRDK